MHGYDVTEHILAWSGDVLKVQEGALYPALHRLKLRGLLASEWGVSANNRRAKYYRLTAAGRKQLAKEQLGPIDARRGEGTAVRLSLVQLTAPVIHHGINALTPPLTEQTLKGTLQAPRLDS